MGDVTQILINAQSGDGNIRNEAERQLEQARESNFEVFAQTMVGELANESKPKQARMLAALMMKNALYAKNETRRAELQARWATVSEQTRTNIKAGCLNTLQTADHDVRTQASQVIAKIGLCELPHGQWIEVIGTLKDMAIQSENLSAKHGSLQSLGFICQEISEAESDCLEDKSNDILTAVIQGMRKEEQNADIRFAAVSALGNALEFAAKNFESDQERHYIMEQLCECTQAQDDRVRKEALDCLAQIAYYHYRYLPTYVPAISNITLNAIKQDKEEVATVAMEFWSTIVDEELSLMDAIEEGEAEAAELHNITKQATPIYVPVLLDCLKRDRDPDDDDDDSTWTVPKAAAVCLALFAQCAKDDVVDHVMPFVNKNVGDQNWIFQDAAVQAFGSILEGPSIEKLGPWVQQAVGHFLDQLVNQQVRVQVRDTIAWVIASILEFCPQAIPPEMLNKLLERLLLTLQAEARVAVHSCYGFSQLISYVENGLTEDNPETTQLSQFTQHILTGLVTCSNRDDADDTANGHELFSCAYVALADLVRVSGKDMLALLAQLMPVVLQKLAASFQSPISENPNFSHSVQSQCCGVLNALCNKLPAESLAQHANDMMQGFLMVFNSQKAEVHEEALMAISALALAINKQFVPYMQALFNPLKAALENMEDHQVCAAAIGVVGDLSRALEADMKPYCEEIMLRLMNLLMHQSVHRDVKPPILATFGDIALAIGADFQRFMEHSMTMLYNASSITLEMDDPDNVEYVNKLYENIIEGYSGIIQALRDADKQAGGSNYVNLLTNYLPNIGFLLQQKIHAMPPDQKDEAVMKVALALLGDLAQALPAAKPSFSQQWVQELIQMGQQMGLDQEDIQFAARILQ
jgi:importin subunit beta-1